MYSPYAMQRRPDLYPEVSEKFADPGIFSPERWENWTPKPWQFIPFNGGPRICIGQNFAVTEMALTSKLYNALYVNVRADYGTSGPLVAKVQASRVSRRLVRAIS